jgi:hypothetical protein
MTAALIIPALKFDENTGETLVLLFSLAFVIVIFALLTLDMRERFKRKTPRKSFRGARRIRG